MGIDKQRVNTRPEEVWCDGAVDFTDHAILAARRLDEKQKGDR